MHRLFQRDVPFPAPGAPVRTLLLSTLALAAMFAASPHALAETKSANSSSRSGADHRSGESSIQGRVTAFDGRFRLRVRDVHGYTTDIRLFAGTIIAPSDIPLLPGLNVGIRGIRRGPVFVASEIDTPYHSYPYPIALSPQYTHHYSPHDDAIGARF